MTVITEKQPDQRPIVAALALDFRLPVGEVTALYEHERAELAVGARVTQFLPIFAIRNVVETLRRRGSNTPQAALGRPACLAA